MHIIKSIQNRIYPVRNERVMLDVDLASLYEVETRVLNQAVKRNAKRFPNDFMFQLTSEEWERLQQDFIEPESFTLTSQIVILKKSRGQHRKYLPYAFTEHGIAMLSGVLNSDRAIKMNIAIMRVFVELRKLTLQQTDLKDQLKLIQNRWLNEHDVQLFERPHRFALHVKCLNVFGKPVRSRQTFRTKETVRPQNIQGRTS